MLPQASVFDTKNAPPIQPKTERLYLASIKAQFRRSTALRTTDWEMPAHVEISDVVADLIARTDLSDSTKYPYRSALVWFIRCHTVSDPMLDQSLQALATMRGAKAIRRTVKKRREISEEDVDKLLSKVNASSRKSIWARRLSFWISASLPTGLRPVEWLDAEWIDEEKSALRVKTAKVKLLAPAFMRPLQDSAGAMGAEDSNVHDTSYDVCYNADHDDAASSPADAQSKTWYRNVPVPDAYDRTVISWHLEAIREYCCPQGASQAQIDERFRSYYTVCTAFMNRACKAIWGGKRSYTLGTMRSQFSANMKAALGSGRTAELMGHYGPDSPATAHYGKRGAAHARFVGMGGERAMPANLVKLLQKKGKLPITPQQDGIMVE